jgi:D-alanyl-D-alanine carboxypeptidase
MSRVSLSNYFSGSVSVVLGLTIVWQPLLAPANIYAQSLPPTSSIQALVNPHHLIQPFEYVPPDLMRSDVRSQVSTPEEAMLRQPAAKALESLFAAAHSQGMDLILLSGYRAYASQAAVYVQNLHALSAEALAAPPATSEHQLGLAADIGISKSFCAAQGCFVTTRAADWLVHNAPRYGFIIRYPYDGMASTGYAYEPWHLRYVGTRLASYLQRRQETLEEYYGLP